MVFEMVNSILIDALETVAEQKFAIIRQRPAEGTEASVHQKNELLRVRQYAKKQLNTFPGTLRE